MKSLKQQPPPLVDIWTALLNLKSTLRLSDRWKNWFIRLFFGSILIFTFTCIILGGPLPIILLALVIQTKCFHEVINIGHAAYKLSMLPWLRTSSWYFFYTANYFFYGEFLVENFKSSYKADLLSLLLTYHRFISFMFYTLGFVLFVIGLVAKHYKKQFSLFAWTHVTLLLTVIPCYMIIRNILHGIIWFLLPVSVIICNDIFAYFFGFFFGKTPLIKLSPKKTWEGFIGGGFVTVLFGMCVAHFLCGFEYFVCPVEYDAVSRNIFISCKPGYLFQLKQVNIPFIFCIFCDLFNLPHTISIYPFVYHSLYISAVCAIIGPFGGFFASGLKRAFKLKDFGQIIPGHGGFTDRFDCQFLMAMFVAVYIQTFIEEPSPNKVFESVLQLNHEQQRMVHSLLTKHLEHLDLH